MTPGSAFNWILGCSRQRAFAIAGHRQGIPPRPFVRAPHRWWDRPARARRARTPRHPGKRPKGQNAAKQAKPSAAARQGSKTAKVLRLLRRLLLLLAVVVFPLAPQIRSPDRTCDFDSYHSLKIGTPIRGGHEDLAIERAAPTYPEEAKQSGIRGRVDAQVLVNRAGDVVRVCAVGERLSIPSVLEAVSRWKFQKEFGFTFSGDSPARSAYPLLRLSFNFAPGLRGEPLQNAAKAREANWGFRSACHRTASSESRSTG
jgi:hypothetical protein